MIRLPFFHNSHDLTCNNRITVVCYGYQASQSMLFASCWTGRYLASGGDDETVNIWSLHKRSCCQTLEYNDTHWGQITCMSFIGEEGAWLAFGTGHGLIYVYGRAKGGLYRYNGGVQASSISDPVESLAFDGPSNRLVVTSHFGHILAYKTKVTFHQEWSKTMPKAIPHTTTFVNEGKEVLVGLLNTGEVMTLASDGGATIATKSVNWPIGNCTSNTAGNMIILQNIAKGFDLYKLPELIKTCSIETKTRLGLVKDVRFAENGSIAVGGSDSGKVYVMDLKLGAVVQELPHSKDHEAIQAVDSDCYLIASASGTGSHEPMICLWEKPELRQYAMLEKAMQKELQAVFGPDGDVGSVVKDCEGSIPGSLKLKEFLLHILPCLATLRRVISQAVKQELPHHDTPVFVACTLLIVAFPAEVSTTPQMLSMPPKYPVPSDPDQYIFHEGMNLRYYLEPRWWTHQFGWLSFIDQAEHLGGYPLDQSSKEHGSPVWLGLLSFIIAYGATGWERRKATVEEEIPDWFSFLSSKGFDFPWLEGFIQLLSGCGSQPPIQWFIVQGVPVWYPWTSQQVREAQEWPHLFGAIAPLMHILQELHTYLHRPLSPSDSSQNDHKNAGGPATAVQSSDPDTLAVDTFRSPFNPDSPTPLPSPAEGSLTSPDFRQPPGWISFFDTRDMRNVEREKTESQQHHSSRLDHEKNTSTMRARGLYEWVEDPHEPGGWCQEDMNIKREHRADILGGFSSTQKRYDSWTNEWDICLAWGEDPDAHSDDEDFYGADIVDNDHNDISYDAESDLASHKFQRTPSPNISVAKQPDDGETEETSNFLHTLASQFGFVLPAVVDDDMTEPNSSAELRHILKAFGQPLKVAQTLSPSTAYAISQFLGNISSKQHPAVERWDVNPEYSQSLSFHPCLFTLKVDCQHTTFVFAKDPHISSSWILAVHNRHDIYKHGIPFRTLIRLNNTFGAHKPPIPPIISFRPADYKFSARDYQAYVENRTNILNKPHSRAALLQGGIVWRLAKEHLSLDAALHGPSSTVIQSRTGYVFGDKDDAWSLWDDDLVGDEADLICGLHKCYTGYRVQVAYKSWWPLPYTWDAAGVNMGFWSDENERWYQQRLQDILDGKAEPLGAEQWRNKLRGYPATRKLQGGLYALSCLPGLA
ncbi:hypothetical protein EV421DRAFT_1744215 [Armillaria borealis]|uniref:WD40 repeat-like protein n=1 Tax=Armillaria borealis TaxID=47425 RepID=A0AA39MD01_9AGAR|nr:hypothetical protein EV421DRAFT_1744215 [Armillaria borealis]